MANTGAIVTLIVALSGGAAAGVFGSKLNSARLAALSEAAAARSDLEARSKALASCKGDLESEKDARELNEKVATVASASVAATTTELEELRKQRAETESRLAAFKAMTEKLRKMIDSGKLQVALRSGRMIVKLPASVLFASGSADLSKDGQSALAEVAAILKQFPDRRFMIAGHTDNIPIGPSAYKNNWELSTARAVTVTTQLVAAGMSPKRLTPAGYGEHDPVRPNNSEAGRQENRRIEIVLLPNLAELPVDPTILAAGTPAKAGATAGK